MVKGYIYRHWIINDKGIEKSYIGQTINELEIRWQKNGRGYLLNGKGEKIDSKFSRAIKKYGWNNFHHEVVIMVEKETKEELKDVLNTLEKAYIELYDSFYNGYNSTTGGDSCIFSDDVRNKMSESADKKPVVCLNTGEIFNSIVEANTWFKGEKSTDSVTRITRCCRGLYSTAGKHPETGEKLVWAYLDDYQLMTQADIEERLGDFIFSYENLNENVSYNQEMFKESLNDKLQPILTILSPMQKLVFIEHFINDKTLKEIAEERKVSTTRIGNLSKQVEKKIKERYTYEEFANLIK